jgi:transcriptional regulator with XRE-family HTH domain
MYTFRKENIDAYIYPMEKKKEELLKKIGLNIYTIRKKKKIKQVELAKECGFTKSSMGRIESGGANLTVGTLLKISLSLNVSIVDLFK